MHLTYAAFLVPDTASRRVVACGLMPERVYVNKTSIFYVYLFAEETSHTLRSEKERRYRPDYHEILKLVLKTRKGGLLHQI